MKKFTSSILALSLAAVAAPCFAEDLPRIENSTATADIDRAKFNSIGGSLGVNRLGSLDTGTPQGVKVAVLRACGGSVTNSHVKVTAKDATINSSGGIEVGVIEAGRCTSSK